MTQAHVDITLQASVTAPRELHLRVTVTGLAPQLYDDVSGQAVPGNGEPVLKTRLDYGDGSPLDGSDGGPVSCRSDAPLVPVNMVWEDAGNSRAFTHTYATNGSYSVKFTVSVCALGDVTRSVDVSVQ